MVRCFYANLHVVSNITYCIFCILQQLILKISFCHPRRETVVLGCGSECFTNSSHLLARLSMAPHLKVADGGLSLACQAYQYQFAIERIVEGLIFPAGDSFKAGWLRRESGVTEHCIIVSCPATSHVSGLKK